VTTCLDQLDPFFIERGLPAGQEIGERETEEILYMLLVQVRNPGQDFSVHPSPPFSQPADKGSHMVI